MLQSEWVRDGINGRESPNSQEAESMVVEVEVKVEEWSSPQHFQLQGRDPSTATWTVQPRAVQFSVPKLRYLMQSRRIAAGAWPPCACLT
jgi:hypothetical protein